MTNQSGQEANASHVSCQSTSITTANSANNAQPDSTLKGRFANVSQKIETYRSAILMIRIFSHFRFFDNKN
jgi:hypothetical protein